MSPRATDSDLNRAADAPIELVEVVECPACAGEFDAVFVTDARDEDGLADLVEVTAELVCPDCGRRFEAAVSGWLNYGSPG